MIILGLLSILRAAYLLVTQVFGQRILTHMGNQEEAQSQVKIAFECDSFKHEDHTVEAKHQYASHHEQ